MSSGDHYDEKGCYPFDHYHSDKKWRRAALLALFTVPKTKIFGDKKNSICANDRHLSCLRPKIERIFFPGELVALLSTFVPE